MRLQIKTLSPLHIGSGEKYGGFSYVVDDENRPRKVFILDFDRVKKLMGEKDKESFTDWVIKENNPNWFNFSKHIKNQNLLEKIKKSAVYVINNKSKEKLRDIDCFIKQVNRPYIPGSEIKGALRTAIAYWLLNDEDLWRRLQKKLEEFQKKYKYLISESKNKKNELIKKMGKIEDEMQNMVFKPKNKKDAKYDLLKFLSIGDSELKKPDNCLFISQIKILNISKTLKAFQEFCEVGQSFTCDFRLEGKNEILDRLGFDDKQKGIVSDVNNIFKCCFEFSNRLLEEEINYDHYPESVRDKLKKIKGLNEVNSPVIRIGKNEGYLSLTVGLLVKDRDKAFYDNVLRIATKGKSYSGNFPKTRRIVSMGDDEFDTCGWVKLSIQG